MFYYIDIVKFFLFAYVSRYGKYNLKNFFLWKFLMIFFILLLTVKKILVTIIYKIL